jgi:hypothetical protein
MGTHHFIASTYLKCDHAHPAGCCYSAASTTRRFPSRSCTNSSVGSGAYNLSIRCVRRRGL